MQTHTTPASRTTVTVLPAAISAHRTEHGGSQWSMPEVAAGLQPQDGVTLNLAMQRRAGVKLLPAKIKSAGGFSSVVTDPEDARLTGGTRSLMRRLLGLNLRKPGLKKAAALRTAQAA